MAPAGASRCPCPHHKELYHPSGWLSSDLCPSCAARSDSRGRRLAGAKAKAQEAEGAEDLTGGEGREQHALSWGDEMIRQEEAEHSESTPEINAFR